MSRCVQTFGTVCIQKIYMGDADNFIDGSHNLSALLKLICPLKKYIKKIERREKVNVPIWLYDFMDFYMKLRFTCRGHVTTNSSSGDIDLCLLLVY